MRDVEVDWQNPSLSRFEAGKKVIVLTHGWWAVDQEILLISVVHWTLICDLFIKKKYGIYSFFL